MNYMKTHRKGLSRLAALALTVASLGGVAVITAPAATAASCSATSDNFSVLQNGAGIGTLHINANTCSATNATGSVVWEPNALGTGTGWTYKQTAKANLGSPAAKAHSWSQNGVFNLCVPTQVSPFCGYGESYRVTWTGVAPGFVGPRTLPRFVCTNTYCTQAMRFVYTGTN